MHDAYLSVRVGVGGLVIKSYNINIMNRPLLSRLTSCGTASLAMHGGRLVVRGSSESQVSSGDES
jgi:hypothetical protein